jgi:hypothetical protein
LRVRRALNNSDENEAVAHVYTFMRGVVEGQFHTVPARVMDGDTVELLWVIDGKLIDKIS